MGVCGNQELVGSTYLAAKSKIFSDLVRIFKSVILQLELFVF